MGDAEFSLALRALTLQAADKNSNTAPTGSTSIFVSIEGDTFLFYVQGGHISTNHGCLWSSFLLKNQNLPVNLKQSTLYWPQRR